MADAAAAPPSEPSDPAPPTRSSKGKGRQIQEDIPAARPATPPYALRASKRHKPSIVSPEIIADEETTPRKADAPSGKDIPRVEIEQASPPARPTPPPPIAKVAVGDVSHFPIRTLLDMLIMHLRDGVGPARRRMSPSVSLRLVQHASQLHASSATRGRRPASPWPLG